VLAGALQLVSNSSSTAAVASSLPVAERGRRSCGGRAHRRRSARLGCMLAVGRPPRKTRRSACCVS